MTAWTPPNDPIGAFCRDNHVSLSGAGTGPLVGRTFAVKDAFHIKGARTGFGQPDWLRTHEPASKTAAAVDRLIAAGADLIAKTYCDELCYSLTGENVHYGTPINVNAPGRIPGGSSNGSAAAVAGGLVDFALGTDCGGSVRIPASYCGILGIRPTHGRVSVEGVIPFGPSFDVVGWFARDATLFQTIGDVLLDPHPVPPAPKRVIIARDAFDLIDPKTAKALEPALKSLNAIVGRVEEIEVSLDGLSNWFEVFRTIQAAEIWRSLGAWVTAVRPNLGPGVKERFEYAATVTQDEMDRARLRRRDITSRIEEILGTDGILCLPTSPRVAPPRGAPADIIEVEFRNQAMCLLCIAGLGGLPQISLPIASLDELPLGLSIIGPRNSDSALLALARRVVEFSQSLSMKTDQSRLL